MTAIEQLATVGNEDVWRVVWTGSNDPPLPVDPDEVGGVAMTWEFRARGDATPTVVTQSLSDALATGTFETRYTPTVAGAYVVKASCVIQGAAQSTPETSRAVVP